MDEVNRLKTKVENYPSPSAYNRLAELLRISGDQEGAVEVARQGIKEFPRNGQGYVILATVELARGERDDAVRLLRTSVDRDPRCYGGYRMLADLLVEDGDLSGAIACCDAILGFKPHDEAVRKLRGDLTGRNGATAPAPIDDREDESDAIDLFATDRPAPTAPVATAPLAARIATPRPSAHALGALAAEQGIRGAVIADGHGRAVAEEGLEGGRGDLVAALAAEVTGSADAAVAAMGAGRITSWSIVAASGQALAYRHAGELTVIALAERGAKPALIELRARQSLLDLEGG